MKYIHIEHLGHDTQLLISETPIPSYSDTQILVKVHATALNRADLMQRMGKYPPPPGETDILGLEVSGTVVALGAKVTQFKQGDRVYGLVGSGGYAEYCPVESSLAHLIPSGWSDAEAAALPEALTTVYATIYDLGQLQQGQTLLIHGASSGIGSMAIQMAKYTGAKIITTVGDPSKISRAIQLGAFQAICHKDTDFDVSIEDNSIDLIIDFIGGDYFNKHLNLLKNKGRLIQIACMKGNKVDCNLMSIIRKRLQITGFVLRSQNLDEKSRLWKLAHQDWTNALEQQKLKPIIDSEFDLHNVEQAHQRMQEGKHFGKIVIQVSS